VTSQDVSLCERKYYRSMEMLVTSSIIPYLKILYPHTGPPTTPGPQAPHHLNPALIRIKQEKWKSSV